MKTLFLAFACLVSGTLAAANLGDPAPPLKISEWVKGDKVDLAEGRGKTLYVVEFWATWCPPCRASIPHLTELQKKYKDKNVVIIGITDENASTVKSFVKKMAEKMEYTVAIDDDSQTGAAYMQAYGVDGIPHAFIVNKEGALIWHGHPMGELDKTLEGVLAGTYDLAKAQKRASAQELFDEFFALSASGENQQRADALAKQLQDLDKELDGLFPNGHFNAAEVRKNARFEALIEEYHELMQGDSSPDKERALMTQIKNVAPKDFDLADFRRTSSLQMTYAKYLREAAGGADKKKMADLASQLKKTDCRNPSVLNDIAWDVLTNEHLHDRDLSLALQLAKLANDATKGQDPNVLDTYARALFDSGKPAEAAREQKKAVDLATEEDQKAEFSKTLRQYQQVKE
jgi:thiol-disulfide isomerase/thioredoxin